MSKLINESILIIVTKNNHYNFNVKNNNNKSSKNDLDEINNKKNFNTSSKNKKTNIDKKQLAKDLKSVQYQNKRLDLGENN